MAADAKPIRTEAGHAAAPEETERLWGAPLGSPDGDRLDVLATLIDAYENEHHPMDPPDPVSAIEFRLEQLGLTTDDLAQIIRSQQWATEVLNRKRNLSLPMIRRLHDRLGISAEVLIRPARTDEVA